MGSIKWPACWNVRDLGGIALAGGGETKLRRVVRAGNLSRLSEVGRDALLEYGVRLVIDLRDGREHAIELDPFDPRGRWAGQVAYVSEPLISAANWDALNDPEQRKRGLSLILELSSANVRRVMQRVLDQTDGGIVIHCHAGKERTGLVAALLLSLAGCPVSAIRDDYLATDHEIGSLYDEWAAREVDLAKRAELRASFNSRAEEIEGPMEWITQHGGIEEFLASIGLSKPEIARLREKLA